MAIKYLSGNRATSTASDRAGLTTYSAKSWVELDRVTLSGAGNDLDTSTFTTEDHIMILANPIWNSGNPSPDFRFNGDSGSNYARRISEGGGSDATATGQAEIYTDTWGGGASSGMHSFEVMNLRNISAQEKLITHNKVYNRAGVGAGNAPNRVEAVHKWANTSAQINRVQLRSSVSSAFASGSEIVILGAKSSGTVTDKAGFWQELASVDLSGGASDTISSGTFTAKKYLMYELYAEASGGQIYPNIRVGNGTVDSGSNYARRNSGNYASDGTNTGDTYFGKTWYDVTSNYIKGFIINKSDKEKLGFAHGITQNSAGAGTAPASYEEVMKWVNTSAQINIIDAINTGSGDFGTNSYLKVWGSD